MRPAEFYRTQAGDGAIRRLARKVRIDRLVRLAEADMAGRPPLPADFPAGQWLWQRATALAVTDRKPEPIVKGRHLIALGHKPGPHFKHLLNACYEAQLDGTFNDEPGGLTFLNRLLKDDLKADAEV